MKVSYEESLANYVVRGSPDPAQVLTEGLPAAGDAGPGVRDLRPGGRGWMKRSEGRPGMFDVPYKRSPGFRCAPTLATQPVFLNLTHPTESRTRKQLAL